MSKKQETNTNNKKTETHRAMRSNRFEIGITTFLITLVFVGMLVYLGYFVATSEQDMINNSYNSRQQILLSRNYRGSIFSRDG